MRNLDAVRIDWAIVHHVFNKIGVLRKSAGELRLDGGLPEFLAKHVLNGLRDSATRQANFQPPPAGPVQELCSDMLAGSVDDRVRTSQKLAEALFDAAGTDQRVTSGVLVVAIFSDPAQDDAHHLLALIKLDPAGVFRTRERQDSANRLVLEIEPIPDVLPTVREKLQKCAYVDADPAAAEQLLVLDRQVTGPSADFFLRKFLGAELVKPELLTRRLIRAMHRAENNLRNSTDPGRVAQFKQAVDGLLAASTIDLTGWLDGLDAPLRRVAETEIDDAHLDRSFALDQKTLADLRRRVRYEGDHGLVVLVDADFADTVMGEPELNTASGRWRIVIETEKWLRQ